MKSAALALGLLLLAAPAWAAEQENSGGQGEAYGLLNEPGGARALGLGSAYEAVAEDASGLFWNPAAPALAQGLGASMSHENLLESTAREVLSLQMPVTGWLGVGLLGTLVHYGAVELRDQIGGYEGEFEPKEQAVGMAMAVHTGGVAVGLSGRFLRQQLPEQDNTGYSGEAGLLWDLNSIARLGMVFKAVPQADGSVQGRGGAGLSVRAKAQHWAWLGSSSVRLDPLAPSELSMGVEGSYLGQVPVALRAGYSQDFPALSTSLGQRYSAGLGFRYEQYSLDYAYLPWGDFGATHRLTLSFHQSTQPQPFAQAASAPAPAPRPVPAPEPVAVASPVPTPLPMAAPTPAPSSPPSTGSGQVVLGLPAAEFRVLSDGVALARDHEAAGQTEEAIRDYHAAASADPEDREAWRGLARLYVKVGHSDWSKRCWSEVLRLVPGDPEATAGLQAP